jgi:hypothetical protein
MPKVALIPAYRDGEQSVTQYTYTTDLERIYKADPDQVILGESREHVIALLHERHPVNEAGLSRVDIRPYMADHVRIADYPVSNAKTVEEFVNDILKTPGNIANWNNHTWWNNRSKLLPYGVIQVEGATFKLDKKKALTQLKSLRTRRLRKYKKGSLLTSCQVVNLSYACHRAICGHLGFSCQAGSAGRYKEDKVRVLNSLYASVKKAGAIGVLRNIDQWRSGICEAYKYVEGMRKVTGERTAEAWKALADIVEREAKAMGVRQQANKEVREEQKEIHDRFSALCDSEPG